MQTKKWIPLLLLLFCSACSSVVIHDAESVRMEYWEKEGTEDLREEEYLDERNGLIIFENAINSAELLKPQSIITTRPLLTMEFLMEADENRKYHLWVNEDGDGFLQSLHPHKSLTYQMDPIAAEELRAFLEAIRKMEIIEGEIEFED